MKINIRIKKYHHFLALSSLFMLLGILKSQAAIQLPAIFSNHMVLQRNSELTFWGWGIPGETISIAPEWMKGEIIKTQVNNTGKWSARVPSDEAGGPYEIRFSGSSEVTLTDVMLGEVWLCSGQSNMEWSANHGIKMETRKWKMPIALIFEFFTCPRLQLRFLKKTVSHNGHIVHLKQCVTRVP